MSISTSCQSFRDINLLEDQLMGASDKKVSGRQPAQLVKLFQALQSGAVLLVGELSNGLGDGRKIRSNLEHLTHDDATVTSSV